MKSRNTPFSPSSMAGFLQIDARGVCGKGDGSRSDSLFLGTIPEVSASVLVFQVSCGHRLYHREYYKNKGGKRG